MTDHISDNELRALRSISARLAKQLDDAIVEALRRHLKRAVSGAFELHRLAQRLSPVAVEGEPGITYWLDDKPLLWAGPIEAGEGDGKIAAAQELRQLLPDF